MRWKLSKIYYYLILFLIVLNSKVFLFGDWDKEIRYITAVFSILMFVSLCFHIKGEQKFYVSKNIRIWIVIFYTFILIDSIYSILFYDVSLSYVFGQVYIFLYLLLVFPIEYIFSTNSKYF